MTGKILLLGLLLVCVAADKMNPRNGREPTCSDIKGPVLCAMVYNPVCGSDGVTHGNECMLCGKRKSTNQNIWIVKDGPC
ncbi:serine protease inhibitor Kazal-type 1-like [Nerophis ophidion]|uniref:serine protease inhibitor Kazal-type 1-like n=1 Tax=Nerophis ophidion TaxID=159077 RepID=UPI002ADF9C0C|nr:serine protease inhibitor Kazal-type 1-like isoform X2 [Nerophis ophidion]XP_061736208.1 serine protease inhibitor Kazal-type 1-like [Nerophis ophidion]